MGLHNVMQLSSALSGVLHYFFDVCRIGQHAKRTGRKRGAAICGTIIIM